MEYETIDSDQIDDIMQGKTPRPPMGWRTLIMAIQALRL